jgi:hypothetical protein
MSDPSFRSGSRGLVEAQLLLEVLPSCALLRRENQVKFTGE